MTAEDLRAVLTTSSRDWCSSSIFAWDFATTTMSGPHLTINWGDVDPNQIDWAKVLKDYRYPVNNKEEKLPEVSEKDMEDLWN